MPLRPYPKIFQVLVKTHTLTVFLALSNEASISEVKEQVLSAFGDDVFKGIQDVPRIMSLDDFVLSREVQDRASGTTSYEPLTDDQLLRDVVGSWAVLFIQFKDESGKMGPVKVTLPSLIDDDDDMPRSLPAGIDSTMEIDGALEESSVRKGKRKAMD
ncbi:hypothetical protein BGW80DRAFT_1283375 [Lactifluus volemus]|nr:hypothetical protein BGW80DRAFT_1283375 [Lactifluus volemus]